MLQKTLDRIRQTKAGGMVFAVIGEIGRQKVAANAAALSFYLFLAIIPLFTLLCSLLPSTGIQTAELAEALRRVTPEAVHGLVDAIVLGVPSWLYQFQ